MPQFHKSFDYDSDSDLMSEGEEDEDKDDEDDCECDDIEVDSNNDSASPVQGAPMEPEPDQSCIQPSPTAGMDCDDALPHVSLKSRPDEAASKGNMDDSGSLISHGPPKHPPQSRVVVVGDVAHRT